MSDCNLEPENQTLQNFLNTHDLVNLLKDKTCWKSSSGSCVDLTNQKYPFQFIYTLETCLSDHYLLIHTVDLPNFEHVPYFEHHVNKGVSKLITYKLIDLVHKAVFRLGNGIKKLQS